MNYEYICGDDFLTLVNIVMSTDKQELHELGILDERDILEGASLISRGDISRILYGIITRINGEEDEEDWSAALELKDIYECKVCFRYVAQIYAKGIMDKVGGAFVRDGYVTPKEAELFVRRAADRSLRNMPKPAEITFARCSIEDIYALFNSGDRYVLVDLRNAETVAARPLKGNIVNISLEELTKNPYQISDDLNIPVYTICEYGYKSIIAADILMKHGYRNVITGGEYPLR